ncbi:HDOD domain-containing protein [Acidaminobacter sp. JC074]|uniref:EAL and HDOD domain-containing protein n=1 Tax=Acidaminobacter sp. JC074 TaxID=2530199 RepID=UPI001F0ED7ED|nr:HDOD domain-containing protein [Acidaminobacter sp. JC074]MCH4889278.1 HDOD domain-containing protein [Acidaminobacter sp. JC074]
MKTFIARQPMFNSQGDIVAYELLFRSSTVNKADVVDDYSATLKVIKDLIINFDIQEMSNNKKVFVNFNDESIIHGAPELFNIDQLVIEVLEDSVITDELIEKLQDYKSKGYLIALDDFVYDEKMDKLIEIADIIKLDFMIQNYEELTETVKKVKSYDKILLAEKVETEEDVKFAEKLGCSIFQGYYYQKPKVFEGSDTLTLPSIYLELLDIVDKPVVNFEALADAIKKDSNLTLSFLKLLNSPAYYSQRKITDVKQALVRLGTSESRKTIVINMLKSFTAMDTYDELISLSLRRGKHAELLAVSAGMSDRKEELFMLGLLSLTNVILKRPMESLLKNVPLNADVIDALLGKENQLSKMLNAIILNERGDFLLKERLEECYVSVDKFNEAYVESIKWADAILI